MMELPFREKSHFWIVTLPESFHVPSEKKKRNWWKFNAKMRRVKVPVVWRQQLVQVKKDEEATAARRPWK